MQKAIFLCLIPEFRNDHLAHNIPIGAQVKLNVNEENFRGELTLYVLGHDRDCDGTPLYSLGNATIHKPSYVVKNIRTDTEWIHYFHANSIRVDGYPEESLKPTGEKIKTFSTYNEALGF